MKKIIPVTVPAITEQRYKITLGSGLLKQFHKHVPLDLQFYNFVIITDHTVRRLHGHALQYLLRSHGFIVDLISFPPGEKYKTREMKASLESKLLQRGMSTKLQILKPDAPPDEILPSPRAKTSGVIDNQAEGELLTRENTCIIALGGGVVGDMAGFIAATYLRGVPYIQVPTTLLAILDSSLGGKTAVNTPEGKNMIGAFYSPSAVIADLDCLKTLSDKQLTNGWIEALKIFLTCDAKAFKKAITTQERTPDLIQRAISLKADIVQRDPQEQGLRAVLNFGHTIGHAIEKASDYSLLHGYAVGYGIALESTISYHRGLISDQEHALIASTFRALGIKGAFWNRFDIRTLINLTRRDKKTRSRKVRYILLNGIGDYLIDEVNDHEVITAFDAIRVGIVYDRK